MTYVWSARDQYGVILKKLITAQYKSYQIARDNGLRIRLASSISKLIDSQSSLIKAVEETPQNQAMLEQLIKRNNRLESESISRLQSDKTPLQKEFDAMTSEEQKAYQKQCEAEYKRKRDNEAELLT